MAYIWFFFLCSLQYCFFIGNRIYKENNLNLYSTPHFFALIWSWIESMHQQRVEKIKNYSIDYWRILKCSIFIHSHSYSALMHIWWANLFVNWFFPSQLHMSAFKALVRLCIAESLLRWFKDYLLFNCKKQLNFCIFDWKSGFWCCS